MNVTVEELQLLRKIARHRGFCSNKEYMRFWFMVKKLEEDHRRYNRNQQLRRYDRKTIKKRKSII